MEDAAIESEGDGEMTEAQREAHKRLMHQGLHPVDNSKNVLDNSEALQSAGERRYSTLEASYVTWPEACESGRAKNIRRRGCGSDARHTENGRTLLTQRLADRNRARQSEHPAFRTLTAWQRGKLDHHRGRRTYGLIEEELVYLLHGEA